MMQNQPSYYFSNGWQLFEADLFVTTWQHCLSYPILFFCFSHCLLTSKHKCFSLVACDEVIE